MPKRYDGWIRLRTPDGSVPPGDLIQFARKKLGELIDIYRFNPTTVANRLFNLEDGSVVQVQWDGTTPIATIIPSAEAQERSFEAYTLWVPRGFAVYPAFSDAKGGVGLPVIQQGDDPYARVNLAPGMDKSRWTAGGVCGEVLLSPDLNAAYPTNQQDVYAPLMFHPTRGPNFPWTGETSFDNRSQSASWKPYRIEFEMPRQHYADQSPANAIALFEGINAERSAAGVVPLMLTPRGLYKKAEVATSIMLAAGSTADFDNDYPPTYQHAYDRLTKDGVTGNMSNAAYVSWNRGDGIPQFELRSDAGGVTSVLAEWMADPGTASIITANIGAGAFSNTGERGGYWCATVEEYTSWIAAGNASWKSADLDVPIISWYSFASMNLGFDTFPCVYDAPHHDTVPLVPIFNFTTAQGDCWLNYTRNAAPTIMDVEPAMSRHIFSRGRRIAVAPNGGLVWGACVQTVSTDHGVMDRLIALIHHPEDQPGSLSDGMTRYLRVWWCDIPKRTNLRVDPQNVISGTDSTDTWGWKGGDQIDVGNMPAPPSGPQATGTPNSLKYCSVWKFSKDGKKAACLRDYGAIKDYDVFFADNFVANGVALLNARTVELTFECTSTATTATPTFHNYTAGQLAPPVEIDAPLDVSGSIVQPFQLFQIGCGPTAVDYDANGNLIYALTGRIDSTQQVAFEYKSHGQAYTYDFVYFGTGTASTMYATQFANRALLGSAFTSAGVDYTVEGAAIADIPTGSIAVLVSHPWHTDGVWEDPDPDCRTFTTNLSYGVKMYQRGAKVAEQWYANPDGFVAGITTFCWTNADYGSSAVSLTTCVTQAVQAYYGERFGGNIFSAQFSPTPVAAVILDDVPSGSDCGCGMTFTNFFNDVHRMGYNEWAPRGGLTHATVPLPANDWLIYTKVV